MDAYDEAIKEGYDNEEVFLQFSAIYCDHSIQVFSHSFLMKLKKKNKGQKRRNQRKAQNRQKGKGYQDKFKNRVLDSQFNAFYDHRSLKSNQIKRNEER